MERVSSTVVSSNVIQVLLTLAYLTFAVSYYTNIIGDIIGVALLIIAGLLFFIKIDKKLINLLFISELLVSPIEYFYFTGRIYLLILPYLILAIGYYTKKLNIALILDFLVLASSALPIRTYFGTDEIIIAYYSDKLLLHGLNPYNPALTKNVFTVYPEGVSGGTPYTTGGVVTNLNYPALYILLYLPSFIFHFSPNYIVFTFYLLTPLAIYFLRKDVFPLFIAGYMISVYYLTFSAGGVDDIVWVFFLLLSFLVNDVKLKGILYGIASSYKQDPLLFLPFLIIALGKDRYKFLAYATLTFLIINIYFIALSPIYFFKDILTPVIANIIQIGMGIDIFSINGTFYEYPTFYLLSQVVILLLGIYITWKKKIKSLWVGFVYFIMLFMYRMLYNYIAYLPTFTYVGDEEEIKLTREEKEIIIPSVLISIISLALIFHYGFSIYYTSIHMSIIKVFEENGKVYAILLNVSFDSPYKVSIKPFFRIFASKGLYTGNGLLWDSNASWIKSGQYEIVMIKAPAEYLEFYPSYTIINAYYGKYNGYLILNGNFSSL